MGKRWPPKPLVGFRRSAGFGPRRRPLSISDTSDNLYGTTEQGGDNNCTKRVGGLWYCGTVFELNPQAGRTVENAHPASGSRWPGRRHAGLASNAAGLLMEKACGHAASFTSPFPKPS